ncbi:hypothetical protein IJU97_00295 [bacterium]|nr:hypothetical protein [bacterium]
MHYRSEKEKAEKELTLQEAINGAPEKKTLLDIILETKFYKENKDHIVFKPEFDV